MCYLKLGNLQVFDVYAKKMNNYQKLLFHFDNIYYNKGRNY